MDLEVDEILSSSSSKPHASLHGDKRTKILKSPSLVDTTVSENKINHENNEGKNNAKTKCAAVNESNYDSVKMIENEAHIVKETVQKLRKQIVVTSNVIKEKQLETTETNKSSQENCDGSKPDSFCRKMSDRLKDLVGTIGKVNHSLDDISSKLKILETRKKLATDQSPQISSHSSLITGQVSNINDLIDEMVPIGHGGEGRVFRGRLRSSNQSVVVKSYFLDCEQSSRIEYAMLVLAHNVRGVKTPIGLINTHSCFFLIVEDDHNSVPLDAIVDKAKLSETQIQCIFSQMAHILYDLKKKLIKHRDIKLDNFLLNTNNGRLSIIDFGWAMYSSIDMVTIDEVKRSGETLMGTFDYLPPENESPSGTLVSYEKATVFALGCILIELFFGYQGKIRVLIVKEGILALINRLSKAKSVTISRGAISLIDRCTKIKLEERLSLDGILLHPWVPSDKLDTVSFRSSSGKFRKIKSFEM